VHLTGVYVCALERWWTTNYESKLNEKDYWLDRNNKMFIYTSFTGCEVRYGNRLTKVDKGVRDKLHTVYDLQ
jgi:hypothetical protein